MQPVIPPTHQLLFESPNIGSVAFSPDGRTVYVHLRLEEADAWNTAVHYWPELLGGGLVLLALLAASLTGRILRRRRRAGDPHCRRCNYNLAGLSPGPDNASPRCPECGASLIARRPVVGRATWKRLIPVLAPVVLLSVLYAALLLLEVPRDGRASVWLSWPSPTLTALAQKPALGRLHIKRNYFDRVVAVDTATGRRLRTVFTRRGATFFSIAVSPDGHHLFVSGDEGRTLDRIRIAGARVEGRFPLSGRIHPQTPMVIGFGDGGRTVYVAHSIESPLHDLIQAWCPDTGDIQTLVQRPSFQRMRPIRAILLSAGPPARFLVASNFTEAYHTGHYRLHVYTAGGAEPRSHDLPSMSKDSATVSPSALSPSCDPVATPDGRLVFISTGIGGIFAYDLESGAPATPLAATIPWDKLGISPDGARVYVGVHGGAILALDATAGGTLATLPHDRELIAPFLNASPDGRWLAAVPFRAKQVQGTGSYVRELLIYDLTAIPGAQR